MVKFKLNKQLDKDMASQFLGSVFGGVDFGKSVWENHPELEKVTSEDDKVINNYFDNFYKLHSHDLQEKADLFQHQWDEIEESFINSTVKLFNGYSFPVGSYTGYVSSFSCNPRFLENKTFQIFYKSDTSVSVTSHELMHFIFYSYTSDRFPELTQDLDTNNGLWWDVAEIFNNVVLSSEIFKQILKTKGDYGYPDHQKFIPRAKDLYSQSKDINGFIQELFELLKE